MHNVDTSVTPETAPAPEPATTDTPCPTDGDLYSQVVTQFSSSAGSTMAGEKTSGILNEITTTPNDADLSTYLARPVRIKTYEWTAGFGTGFHIDPWALWLNDPRVRDKLDGFKYLRGTLCLEIMINGNPFQYGSMMMAYEYANGIRYGDPLDVRQRSMQPHVLLSPTASKSHTMCLPYTSPYDYIDLLNGYALLGVLNIDVLNQIQALDGTVAKADISIFAWMVDPVLVCPTSHSVVAFVEQGMISEPAAFVSNIASRLTDIPVIGRFARATEIGSSAIGAIASLFGFSRPLPHGSTSPMVPQTIDKMAPTDTPFNAYNLALSTNNELSIDPQIFGFDKDHDELAFSNFIHRDTYSESIVWEEGDAVDDEIWSAPVSPMYGSDVSTIVATYTRAHQYRITSMALPCFAFNQWRGGITFTIRPIVSKFHRGRVRIYWEPDGLPAGTPGFNQNYGVIIDIQEDKEYCITVPYLQDQGFLETNTHSAAVGKSTNGRLIMTVVNQLTAQGTTTPSVDFQVWVRGAPDLQFAGPKDMAMQTNYSPQSEDSQKTEIVNITWGDSSATSDLHAVHNGEIVTSFRPLLKRVVPTTSLGQSGACTSGSVTKALAGGFLYPSPNGIFSDTASHHGAFWGAPLRSSSDFTTWNNPGYGSIFKLLNPCFVGRRGSYRWGVKFQSQKAAAQAIFQEPCSIVRCDNIGPQCEYFTWDVDSYGASNNINPEAFIEGLNAAPSFQGGQVTNGNNVETMMASIPDYNHLRYHIHNGTTNTANADTTQRGLTRSNARENQRPVYNWWKATTFIQNKTNYADVRATIYSAAGDDFTFLGFVGIPHFNICYELDESTWYDFTQTLTRALTLGGINDLTSNPAAIDETAVL